MPPATANVTVTGTVMVKLAAAARSHEPRIPGRAGRPIVTETANRAASGAGGATTFQVDAVASAPPQREVMPYFTEGPMDRRRPRPSSRPRAAGGAPLASPCGRRWRRSVEGGEGGGSAKPAWHAHAHAHRISRPSGAPEAQRKDAPLPLPPLPSLARALWPARRPVQRTFILIVAC